ncbi:DUF3299 domain-containing protein [Sulfitobacter sp. 1151]|uniref:DUF3299 domain-containing protein n=1 Tax=Parasulfitobacter algicola TaxID=2614809 RepID=A0ABX2IT47_9RHOB|nr:DUF3299 domain-containing protein [Sulfitobacter algicola]
MCHLNRRTLLTGIAASTLLPGFARAEDYIDLDWEDLLPEGQSAIPNALRGLLSHDEGAAMSSQQPPSMGVRTEWNGQIVRLPGFIVPIEYTGTGVTAFILVPYVGACVHVPPPPANQLVFVTTSTPYESDGLFEAVNVIGMFGVSSLSTHLAEIGYALSADIIEPYRV